MHHIWCLCYPFKTWPFCIKQRLHFAFKSKTILNGMTYSSSMIITSSIWVIPPWVRRLQRLHWDWSNLSILKKFWEELSVWNQDWIILGKSSLLTSFWVRIMIWVLVHGMRCLWGCSYGWCLREMSWCNIRLDIWDLWGGSNIWILHKLEWKWLNGRCLVRL